MYNTFVGIKNEKGSRFGVKYFASNVWAVFFLLRLDSRSREAGIVGVSFKYN